MEITILELLNTNCIFSQQQEGLFKKDVYPSYYYLSIKNIPHLFPSGLSDIKLCGLYFCNGGKKVQLSFVTEQLPEKSPPIWNKFIHWKNHPAFSYGKKTENSSFWEKPQEGKPYDRMYFDLILSDISNSYVKGLPAMGASSFTISKKNDTTYTILAKNKEFEAFFEFSKTSEVSFKDSKEGTSGGIRIYVDRNK